jgi:tripartite ATP-independent transporter DctP family solute receptor
MELKLTSFSKGLLAAFAALSLSSVAAQAETLRLGHHHAVGGAIDTASNRFADIVKDKTDGRFEVQVFPAAQLGQEREAYDLVEQGGLDISITSTGFLEKSYPPMALISLPFVFNGWDGATAAFNGEFGETVRSNVRDNSNTEILAFLGLGFRDLFFAGEPATNLAAINGLKMRSPELPNYIKMFQLMGTKPVPVTFGELYTAMQTGVADGFDAPPGTAVDNKFQEVSKGVLKSNHMFSALVFAMNKDKFNALSAEDQALVAAAAKEAVRSTTNEVTIPAEQAAYGVFEDAGVKVAEPDNIQEWVDAMKPMIEEVVSANPGADKLLELARQ